MIDIEKFICSLLADHPVGVTVREDIHKALKDQGLEYKGGKIVPIEDKTELKESEDEKVIKTLIHIVKGACDKYGIKYQGTEITKEKLLAWLEKLGEQDNNEDSNILQRFSFYSYKDEPNILYLSGLYVNEEYRNKGIGTKILEVAEEVAKSLNRHAIRLKTKKDSNAERLYRTHGYNSLTTEDSDEIWLEKQYEQKPADKVSLNFKKGDILYEQKTMSISGYFRSFYYRCYCGCIA